MITTAMAAATHLPDPLSCEEEAHCFETYTPLGGEEEEEEEGEPVSLVLPWDDEELERLSSKEGETTRPDAFTESIDPPLSSARKEGASWLIRASASLGFAAQTTLLAADYFDRFLSSRPTLQPWLPQLASVACLSLAAKVEETHVPLLLDLQVEEETRFVFEPRTVQRMELLVLSTLGWQMNPVTPMSFIDHAVRRLGTEFSKNWTLHQRRCRSILLALVADSRWLRYLPSVLACSTMVYALADDSALVVYKNQILNLLKSNKEEIQSCHQFIADSIGASGTTGDNIVGGGGECLARRKRKYTSSFSSPPSPNCVVGSQFSFDSSNDSWAAAAMVPPSFSSLQEELPLLKKPGNICVRPED